MVDFQKRIDNFRKDVLEKPSKAFWIVYGSYFCVLIIIFLKNYVLAFISSGFLSLFLDFIILMVIYAFYSFYFVPFVLQLPDGKQDFSGFLKSLKLTRNGFSTRSFFLGLVIGILLLLGYFCIDIILGEFCIFRLNFNQIIQPPNLSNFGYFNFIYHITPAFWEEIIFRGIMLTILLKIYPVRMAIIVDGIFFGLVHIANHANLFIGLSQGIYTSCSGIILAYLYVKTSNLIPSMIAHYVNNILAGIISIEQVNVLVLLSQQCLLSIIVLILGFGILKLYDYIINHLISKDSLNRNPLT